jgi:hypothetical protein
VPAPQFAIGPHALIAIHVIKFLGEEVKTHSVLLSGALSRDFFGKVFG